MALLPLPKPAQRPILESHAPSGPVRSCFRVSRFLFLIARRSFSSGTAHPPAMLQALPPPSLPPPPPVLPPSHDPVFPAHLFPISVRRPLYAAQTSPVLPLHPPAPMAAKRPPTTPQLPSPAFAFLSLPTTRVRQKRSSAFLCHSDTEDDAQISRILPSPSKKRRHHRRLSLPPSPSLLPPSSSPTAPSPLVLPLVHATANEKMDVDDVFAWPRLEDLGLPRLKPEEEAVLPEREQGRLPNGGREKSNEEEAYVMASGEVW